MLQTPATAIEVLGINTRDLRKAINDVSLDRLSTPNPLPEVILVATAGKIEQLKTLNGTHDPV